jgi:hypothetical protein
MPAKRRAHGEGEDQKDCGADHTRHQRPAIAPDLPPGPDQRGEKDQEIEQRALESPQPQQDARNDQTDADRQVEKEPPSEISQPPPIASTIPMIAMIVPRTRADQASALERMRVIMETSLRLLAGLKIVLAIVPVVVLSHAGMCAAEDSPADLPVLLQSAALILGDCFAGRLALLYLLLLILRDLAECRGDG